MNVFIINPLFIGEGSPLPTKISNNKLARLNGTLDPNIRLPMDKYRPSPETHGDIISEKLWSYLSKAYGVQGKAYNEGKKKKKSELYVCTNGWFFL